MTCWISEDAPTARCFAGIEQRRAELDCALLGVVEVRNSQIQVELLGTRLVRPLRGRVVFDPLEGEYQPGLRMEGRPGVVERPSPIGFVHDASEERRVEPGKLLDIRTVQHHTLQFCDHSGSVDQTSKLLFTSATVGSAELVNKNDQEISKTGW